MHVPFLVVEPFGPDAVMVREVPPMLEALDIKGMVRDLADDTPKPAPRCH